MRFWVVFRSERAVSTIFPPYIMPNGTYERIKKFYDTLPLSLIFNVSDTSCEELDIIPQHGEGESHKESQGSAKVRHEGIKRVDEVLLQNGCADSSIGNDNAKGVEVLVINFLHRILVVGARQEAPCALLNVLLVPCCQA